MDNDAIQPRPFLKLLLLAALMGLMSAVDHVRVHLGGP